MTVLDYFARQLGALTVTTCFNYNEFMFMNELISAAENGDITRVKFLLAEGVDVHAKDDMALRWAAKSGYT